jgi:hypothetical protein
MDTITIPIFCTYWYYYLGNTIVVKLELWELVIVFNKTFRSATNLCLRYTLRQSRGIVLCNFGTSKTVISNFVTTRQIL